MKLENIKFRQTKDKIMKSKFLIPMILSTGILLNVTAINACAYADGTYTGSAEGYQDTITVEVVVTDGNIETITIVEANDDEPFITNAEGVIDSIISSQSTDVDVVSGATYSSKGIIKAVANALKNAEDVEVTEETTIETTLETTEEETSKTDETTAVSDSDVTTESESTDQTSATTNAGDSNNSSSSKNNTTVYEETSLATGDKNVLGIAAMGIFSAMCAFAAKRRKNK